MPHYDSKGNHDVIAAGGVQWMNAGSGIIHEEKPFCQPNGDTFHSLQHGPFVMNSHAEIATAYRDFFEGKYGTIAYR